MADKDIVQRYRLMQRYVGWTSEDADRAAALGPLVSPHADELIADFYAEIRRHPESARVITGGSAQVAHLAGLLGKWLKELLAGNYDESYIARRWRVGYRHVEIGLEQRFVSMALARLRSGIVRSIHAEWRGQRDDLAEAMQSLHKLLDLEHALVQDAYEFEYVQRQRLAERARGERRFRRLVESASCIIMMLGPDHSVLYFNPFAQRLTGYSLADLERQREMALALMGRDRAKTIERLTAAAGGAAPLAYEDLMIVPQGPPRWVNWRISRIEEIDDGATVLAVGYDVTDQKEAAQKLLQASRLAAIGEMYAGLAHESRNALQRIRVCTEMLSDELANQPSAIELLDRSQKAQDDLHRLLDEVRSFAAPMPLELSECRLPTIWRESWGLLHSARKGRRTELIDPVDDVPPIVMDRFRMVQAFRNIFENSLSATDDAVEIRIRCQATRLEERPALEIVIEDNGPGFDNVALHRCMEPFFTTKSAGTGLGLSIVRRIVEAHGGRAAASPAKRGGARIALILPLQPISASEV
jgi:PAS domain S-box-containing protein